MVRPLRILVIDDPVPWVRSLFAAIGEGVQIDFLNVHNIRTYGNKVCGWKPEMRLREMLRWRQLGPSMREGRIFVPSRLESVSCAMMWTYTRLIYADTGLPDAVVFTLPQFSAFLPAFAGRPCIYYAHDIFRYYPCWDAAAIDRAESRMLAKCDLVFAVAKELQQDFRARTSAPVHHLPMAVSESFLAPAQVDARRPSDLPGDRPVVGCIGNINDSYDWELIASLADALPELQLVFIGPVSEPPGEQRRQIEHTLRLSNVIWLGPKRHDELPLYMRHFDVCLCPLRINDHNNRRSPLRLFDYMSTDRPIVTTGISEAYEHAKHLLIAEDPEQCAGLIRQVLRGVNGRDITARRNYMRGHTWRNRAEQMRLEIGKLCESAPGRQRAIRRSTRVVGKSLDDKPDALAWGRR